MVFFFLFVFWVFLWLFVLYEDGRGGGLYYMYYGGCDWLEYEYVLGRYGCGDYLGLYFGNLIEYLLL